MRNYGELTTPEKVERLRRTVRMLIESTYYNGDSEKAVCEKMIRGLSRPGDRPPELKKRGFSAAPTEEDLES